MPHVLMPPLQVASTALPAINPHPFVSLVLAQLRLAPLAWEATSSVAQPASLPALAHFQWQTWFT